MAVWERAVTMKMRWFAAVLLSSVVAHASDGFTKPTPEELSMASLPGFPNAPAVVLFREEITDDDLHVVKHYNRIKILTDEGKKYANVELPFISTNYDFAYGANDKTLDEIEGRTIHADGTIIPFTGKPYLKVIEKEKGVKYQERIFTLPDVEVGSIIEYRYATRIADNRFESPDWYIQGDLYLKAAHYVWYPTERELIDSVSQKPINTISWFPLLPPGTQIERHDIPHSGFSQGPVQYFELTVKDVAPQVKEELMPPIASYSYRVLFNFTSERTADEWWRVNGKDWSKGMDSFADPNSALKQATKETIAGATTQNDQLKKIYALVMSMENTRYTREHEQREEKADHESSVKTVADILSHKRGTPTQLTALFVGMARAAGMKAYFMYVPDRSEEIFVPSWLSFRQFDDEIAIVNVDGKEVQFDPGCRYCEYGHLAWQHTFVRGLRQTDKGTDFGETGGDDYNANKMMRVANLSMDDKEQVTGSIKLTFLGADAVEWRHRALSGDDESFKHELKTTLEEMLPKTLEVKVASVQDQDNYDKPLVVNYDVTGTMGTSTGKRLVIPADLFESGSSATFPHEKREQPVYFHYPQTEQDALRLNFPSSFTVEAVPTAAKYDLPKEEVYILSVVGETGRFTTRRTHVQNEVLVMPKDYDELRKYYSQFETKDQESVVLRLQPASAAAATAVPNGN
jgi:hypothetical protein